MLLRRDGPEDASMAYGYRVKDSEETGVVEATSVSWLDCQGLLDSTQATFCHGTKTSQTPLVSLSFRNADSQVYSRAIRIFRPQLSHGVALHAHNTWDVKGSRLKSLHQWIDASQTLTGLQFLARNGAQSPRWGDCETEGPVELDFQTSSGGRAKGLEVFIDSDGKSDACEDYVVVGFS